jgi:hypothetical protein
MPVDAARAITRRVNERPRGLAAAVGIGGWSIALAMALVAVSAWELSKLVTRAIRARAA